ncbi:M1 family metallopeptidase [Streptococcus moroccensis]|uniref:Aminopeptidase n=1 Tax=Streptococcus moroccensis TaxID=1451356 RepID=A0ABT9YQW6_9STRE|nr:M1 family metallopeptidase [Streptococcus moroccensis]MDQ0222287.1 aminopeptidase N [Streptococcus moroccensis]
MSKVQRLIETFVPENYKLFLDIDRPSKTFKGQVTITGEAVKEQVSLHQHELEILSVKAGDKSLDFTMDDEHEAVHVALGVTGDVVLTLDFAGKITDNMTGIYPSYYTVDGVKKEVIATQFESHFAREAFPCVDEPEAKATFDFSVKFDQSENEIALSNMPEIKSDERKETGVWTFDTTPRMSSYLLAFGLGDLQSKLAKTKGGTEVGIFATKAHPASSLDFALDIAVRVIDFYEDYFKVKYPIPLSYQLALPDFSSGAMENWGLITYREIYLLVDENSSVSSRQQVALVIAHELAHQWFGNLVTMQWWDDLWLNESFANMMEYVAIDAIEPTWNIMEDFQTTGCPHALKRDATDGVQSVHVEVNHPDEINTLFDPAIVYAKGSRLMHMLRRWLGDDAFAAGLKIYFEKHQYGNTVGRDLWDALSQTSGKDVASFMDSWLEQPGYPVVRAKVTDNALNLSQEQFFIGEHEAKGRLWEVPLNSNWSGLPDTLSTAETAVEDFKALADSNTGAFRLNTENTAHYITDYRGELLEALLAELPALDPTTVHQVLQERRLLAEAGHISTADLVSLIAGLTSEKSYMVAAGISYISASLDRFVDEGSAVEKAYKNFLINIFAADYARLGFEKVAGEPDEDEMIRQIVLGELLYADQEDAVAKASALYEAHKDNLASLPASLRSLVLVNQMKNAETDALVDQYLDAYVATNDNNFRRDLASALARANSEKTVNRILESFKDKDIIKPQDLSMWYAFFLRRPFTQERVWAWARENWDWVKSALGGDMSFDKFVIYPANSFKTAERLAEFKAFFEPQLSDMAISRNISMGIKEIAARVALIETEKDAVHQAIEAQNE